MERVLLNLRCHCCLASIRQAWSGARDMIRPASHCQSIHSDIAFVGSSIGPFALGHGLPQVVPPRRRPLQSDLDQRRLERARFRARADRLHTVGRMESAALDHGIRHGCSRSFVATVVLKPLGKYHAPWFGLIGAPPPMLTSHNRLVGGSSPAGPATPSTRMCLRSQDTAVNRI